MVSRARRVGLLVVFLFTLLPQCAQPSSIVSLDSNHDIWITSADGMTKRKVTSDGALKEYRSPSQTDAGTDYVAYVSEQGTQINTADDARTGGTVWITDESWNYRGFDISRSGNKVLITRYPRDDYRQPSDLVLWHGTGTPPAPCSGVCVLPGWARDYDAETPPRWSPDGTQFAWSGAQGLWVSSAPVADSNQKCVTAPKLIVAGASDPDRGLPDVAGAATRLFGSEASGAASRSGSSEASGSRGTSGRGPAWVMLTGGMLMPLVGLGLLVAAFVSYARQSAKSSARTAATGTVVGFEQRVMSAGRSSVYCPVVDFPGPEGVVRFVSDFGSRPAGYSVGQSVNIRYEPSDPRQAEIDSATARWLGAGVMGGIGCIALLLGAFFLFAGLLMLAM